MSVSHTSPNTHKQDRSHKPEALTEPVFAGDPAESLAVGLPSSEEADGAVLPALDHLQMPRQQDNGGVRGRMRIISHSAFHPPPVMSHPESHSWSLSSSKTKLNELISARSFTNE